MKLGRLLAAGYGKPEDRVDAAGWIAKSAENGDGTAVTWLEQAAAGGSPAAQARLADLYARGKGVTADDAKALTLFQDAAEAGEPFAQLQLGLRYASGNGVAQDYVQAHMWANLAAAAGNADAVKSRDAFAKFMTAGQVSEAQRLARDWTAQHQKSAR